jgi:periplasmic divalent cation tolerance protein
VEITFFYTPVATAADALAIGNMAVEQQLAACANVFPIQSVFPWNAEIQQEEEFVLILKTLPSLAIQLRTFLEEKHPYETPCILSWIAEVNEAYGVWVRDQLMSSAQK